MEGVNFTFIKLGDKRWKTFTDRKIDLLLEKWYLKPNLELSFWAFNEPYQPHNCRQLILSLTKQPRISQQIPWKFDDVISSVEPVPSTVTSLEFFDRLLDPANGVVRRGADDCIRGCVEETVRDFTLSDELRQMLLNESSENYALYSREERRELLFRLLQHVVLGGQWCQYEDVLRPYIEVATAFYKDILSVQKNKESGDVEIRSKCFRLVPPEDRNLQDFVYITIDPGLREISVLSHRF